MAEKDGLSGEMGSVFVETKDLNIPLYNEMSKKLVKSAYKLLGISMGICPAMSVSCLDYAIGVINEMKVNGLESGISKE